MVASHIDHRDTRAPLVRQHDQLADDTRRVVGLGDTLEHLVGVQGVVAGGSFAVESVGAVEHREGGRAGDVPPGRLGGGVRK